MTPSNSMSSLTYSRAAPKSSAFNALMQVITTSFALSWESPADFSFIITSFAFSTEIIIPSGLPAHALFRPEALHRVCAGCANSLYTYRQQGQTNGDQTRQGKHPPCHGDPVRKPFQPSAQGPSRQRQRNSYADDQDL